MQRKDDLVPIEGKLERQLEPVKAKMAIRVKSGLSLLLLSEAWRLTRLCEAIEEHEGTMSWPQPKWDDLLGHAAATVVLAASALEAAINETFLEAVDKRYDAFPGLTQAQVDLLSTLWDVVETSRAGLLPKHAIALQAVGKSALPRGTEPHQSADSLIALRDLLVHFKPEWNDELKRHQHIEDRLTSRFEVNRLSLRVDGSMLWFPGKCLGAGCAAWACQTVVDFHGQFADLLGIAARLPNR